MNELVRNPIRGMMGLGRPRIDAVTPILFEGLVAHESPFDGGRPMWCAFSDAISTLPPGRWNRPVASLLVSMDGRLHNRGELLRELKITVAPESINDAELVAVGYHAWGELIFGRLIGEWALALGDMKERHMYLARDYPGARTMYYVVDSGRCTWSTAVEPLLPVVRKEFDVSYLRDFICLRAQSSKTPYEGVKALPGGRYLKIGHDGFELREAYELRSHDSLCNVAVGELAERFGELLRQAVADRVPTGNRYAAELSGGMDSSSIVCLADELWKVERRDPGDFVTITHVSTDSASRVDQSYVRLVNDRVAFENVSTDDDEGGVLFSQQCDLMPTGFPEIALARNARVASYCRERDVGTLLSGAGGDEVAWARRRPYVALADLWQSGNYLELWRDANRASRALKRTLFDVFWNDAVRLAARLCDSGEGKGLSVPWLIDSRTETDWRFHDLECDTLPSRVLFRRGIQGACSFLSTDPYSRIRPARASYPFLDRRLIEFAYNVPARSKARADKSRLLQRQALAHCLPQAVAQREWKGCMTALLHSHFLRRWDTVSSLVDRNCMLAERGLVDLPTLQRCASRIRDGHRIQDLVPLWRTLSVELFLRLQAAPQRNGPY